MDNFSIYKTLFSSDFGMWSWEREGDVLYYNRAYMQMLGYAHDALPHSFSAWIGLLHPEDIAAAKRLRLAMLESGDAGDQFEDTFRLRTASGAYLRILHRGFVLCRDAQGRALRACGIQIDQALLDRAMQEMDVQHDRMLFALEAANDGLWDWNPQTDDVYFSPRYLSMLGYRPEEFPPRAESWVRRIHPDDLGKTFETQREYIESPARGDLFDCVYRFLDANGVYRWILGRGKITKRDENGRGVRVVGLHTDVTELRKAQEALVQQLHRDTLTQLYSRFYFDSVSNDIAEKDYPLSILFCDLDGLKMVNDTLGHADGDKILRQAASFLQQFLPPEAVAARLGGDEFAALLPGTTKPEAEAIVQRMQSAIERHNSLPSEDLPILLSFGVVTSSDSSVPIYKLLSYADEAMLRQKRSQRESKRRLLIACMEKKLGRKISFHDNRLLDDDPPPADE